MIRGYLFAFLAMSCFAIGGILHKVADRKKCTPLMFTVALFSSAALLMSINVMFFRQADFVPPKIVVSVAILFGIFAASAIWVFQRGIRYGSIATSWVIINLSAAIPAIASTLVYKEKIGRGKILAFSLILIALFLLWKDKKDEESSSKSKGTGVQSAEFEHPPATRG
jgi:drug/metabolite transporter (DMT)-like permease